MQQFKIYFALANQFFFIGKERNPFYSKFCILEICDFGLPFYIWCFNFATKVLVLFRWANFWLCVWIYQIFESGCIIAIIDLEMSEKCSNQVFGKNAKPYVHQTILFSSVKIPLEKLICNFKVLYLYLHYWRKTFDFMFT